MNAANTGVEAMSASQRWVITVTVMLGALSAVLATTIINVAIPQIQGAFGMSQDHAQWLFSGTLAAAKRRLEKMRRSIKGWAAPRASHIRNTTSRSAALPSNPSM